MKLHCTLMQLFMPALLSKEAVPLILTHPHKPWPGSPSPAGTGLKCHHVGHQKKGIYPR